MYGRRIISRSVFSLFYIRCLAHEFRGSPPTSQHHWSSALTNQCWSLNLDVSGQNACAYMHILWAQYIVSGSICSFWGDWLGFDWHSRTASIWPQFQMQSPNRILAVNSVQFMLGHLHPRHLSQLVSSMKSVYLNYGNHWQSKMLNNLSFVMTINYTNVPLSGEFLLFPSTTHFSYS